MAVVEADESAGEPSGVTPEVVIPEVMSDSDWFVLAGLVLRLQAATIHAAQRVVAPALWVARPLLDFAGRVLPEAVTWRVEEELRQLAREGRDGVAARGQEARAVVSTVGTVVVQDALVSDIVKQLIDRIGPDLVAELLPSILDQLADESAKVQNIVRGQSRGMVEEIARDARSRAAAGDVVVDRFVARVLHRRTNGTGRGSGASSADLMPKG
jgi:hypothetical protein